MSQSFYDRLTETLSEIEAEGLFKRERTITSQQFSEIDVRTNGETRHVLNFCANNYLGLANRPELIEAAKTALDRYGYGVASVRFICGAQEVHKQLESAIADFTGQEDAILYAAAFDANGGVFEPLLGPEDAIISVAMNNASIFV